MGLLLTETKPLILISLYPAQQPNVVELWFLNYEFCNSKSQSLHIRIQRYRDLKIRVLGKCETGLSVHQEDLVKVTAWNEINCFPAESVVGKCPGFEYCVCSSYL